MSVKLDNIEEKENKEINSFYEKYRNEIIKISNDLKIEEFKEKMMKLKEKENTIFRIKSIENIISISNINNPNDFLNSDKKFVFEYFDSCIDVI
jgi:methyltransferase-like protein